MTRDHRSFSFPRRYVRAAALVAAMSSAACAGAPSEEKTESPEAGAAELRLGVVAGGFIITVNATALTEQQIQLPGVTGSFDSKTPQPVSVLPGAYPLYTAGGGYVTDAHGGASTVIVKGDGTIVIIGIVLIGATLVSNLFRRDVDG